MDTDKPIDILASIANPLPVFDYVLPNMAAGSVGALVSPGGAGKSILALQLASQIAGGPDLLGIGQLTSGPVVYLPSEDPPLAIQYRVKALGQYWSIDERQVVAANVLIHPLISSCRNIMDPEGYARLRQFAEGRRLMLLDTLRRFHVEEENASGAMSQVLGRLEAIAAQTGCSIVFLHHTSKGAALAGGGDQQQASRGSSVLTDNVRWQAYLAGMTSDEAQKWSVDDGQRGFFVRFGISKVNYGPPFSEKWLLRHEGGVLKSAVLDNPKGPRKGNNREEF
jgi:RecA-family ATPase